MTQRKIIGFGKDAVSLYSLSLCLCGFYHSSTSHLKSRFDNRIDPANLWCYGMTRGRNNPKEIGKPMTKTELLNWLQAEYQKLDAFFDQIGSTRMDQAGVAGHWSIKDILAHMNGWEYRNIARIAAALRNQPEPPTPWPANLTSDDEVNGWIYDNNHHRSVDDVRQESRELFQQLLTALQGLPDDIEIAPDYHLFHIGEQRFSASELFDHYRDDHEPDIRAWLARNEVSA